jgi:hypothetical protein
MRPVRETTKDPTQRCVIVPEIVECPVDDLGRGTHPDLRVKLKSLSNKYDYLKQFSGLIQRQYFAFRSILDSILLFARRFLWNVVHSITIEIEVAK